MTIDAIKCPLLNIGDSVTYEVLRTSKRVTAQVVQFKYDDNCQGCCKNKPELALAILSNKDVINPGNSITVDCDKCPLNKEEGGNHMNRVMPKIKKPDITQKKKGFIIRSLPHGPCCYLDCGNGAEWLIVHGDGPCDNTVSCTEHVGYMLTDAPMHNVSHL